MAEQGEIVELRVAIVRRAGGWCIVDRDNRTIAGISEKAFEAVTSGQAATAKELAAFKDEWGVWARKAVAKAKAASEGKPDAWGRRFQGMAQEARRRKPSRLVGRDKRRSRGTSWENRCLGLVQNAKNRYKRQVRYAKDEWARWTDTSARNIRKRAAMRAYHSQGN